jgi:hypothetical protein
MNNQEKYTQYLLNKQRRLKALEEFRDQKSGEIDPETFGDSECGRVLCEKFRGLIKESKSNKRHVKTFSKILKRFNDCIYMLYRARYNRTVVYMIETIFNASVSDLHKAGMPESCITYCINMLKINQRQLLRSVNYAREMRLEQEEKDTSGLIV